MPTSQDNTRDKRASHFATPAQDASPSAQQTPGYWDGGSRGAEEPPSQQAQPLTQAVPMEAVRTPSSGPRGGRSARQMSERTARATERAAAAHKRRNAAEARAARNTQRMMPVLAVLAVAVVVAVAVVGVMVVPKLFQRNEPKVVDYPAGEIVIVTIPDGAGGSQIAQILLENHVISDEQVFYHEIQKQNADASMKSGTYQFVTGATPSEVVKQLVSGPNASEYRLNIPEGLTVRRTAELVEDQMGIPADEFLEQAKASNYVDDYPFLEGVANDSLEGYLFGKTYDTGGIEMSADAVIRMMLDQFQTEVSSLDFDAAREAIAEKYTGMLDDGSSSTLSISDYAFIKIASIIEKEAVTDEDRGLISSVFYNRMGRNFPGLGYVYPYLESDATMMYETGGEVTADDLQQDSPYNTTVGHTKYLPPTPICSPSIESIKAALNPDDTDYFFFFINDKVHQFSETYDEHQQAINESLYG